MKCTVGACDYPAGWTAIPAEQAIILVVEAYGGGQIHRRVAIDWFLSAIKDRKLNAFADYINIYEIPAELVQDSTGFFTIELKPSMSGGGITGDEYMLGIRHETAIGETLIVAPNSIADESRIGRGDVRIGFLDPSIPDTLVVVRRWDSEGRTFVAVSKGIRVFREEVLWFTGAPGGRKPEPTTFPRLGAGNPGAGKWDRAIKEQLGKWPAGTKLNLSELARLVAEAMGEKEKAESIRQRIIKLGKDGAIDIGMTPSSPIQDELQ